MVISFTRAQLLDGQLITPDWYDLKVAEFRSIVSKSGTTIYFVKYSLTSHPDQPEVTQMYNSMNLNDFFSMYAATKGMTMQELVQSTEGNLDVDTDNLVGEECKGRLFHAKRQDTQEVRNEFAEYLPKSVSNPL